MNGHHKIKPPSANQFDNGELVFWRANLWNIWFLELMFMKYEKQLLIWKVICVSCTFNRLSFLCRDCPSEYPGQQHLQVMSAWAKIELVENSKIKFWVSHKNTLADGSFFLLSHLIPIPLIFLHSVTEAKQRILYIF